MEHPGHLPDDLPETAGVSDLGKDLTDLIRAARLCLGQQLPLPALMLLYAGIDTAGWLAADDPKDPKRFTEWVDRYLLPRLAPNVTALELWAARCGVLHTMTAESDLSAAHRVRRLSYSWGSGPLDLHDRLAREGFSDTKAAVRVEALIDAFEAGLNAFSEDLAVNPDRRATVEQRAKSAFHHITEISKSFGT